MSFRPNPRLRHSFRASDSRVHARLSSRPDAGLLRMGGRDLFEAAKREPAAFWLVCAYVVVEYLRPQVMYPVFNVLPWGQLCLLAMTAGALLGGSKPTRFMALDGLMLAFSLLVLVSGLTAWDPQVSWEARNTYLSWVLLYVSVRLTITTPRRALLYWIVFALVNFQMSRHGSSVFIARGLAFDRYGISGPPGWFRNSGELALELVFAFALALSLLLALQNHMTRTKWTILLVVPLASFLAILATSNRGGQLALVVVCVLFVSSSRRVVRGLIAMGVLVCIGWLVLPAEQKARFASMGDDTTSQHRFEVWTDAVAIIGENPATGIGYANWVPFYSEWAPRNSPSYEFDQQLFVVHNTVLEAAVDLGVLGGVVFVALVLAALSTNRTTRRSVDPDAPFAEAIVGMARGLNLGIVGMVLAAQFMSVLFYPVFWMAFAMTAALAEVQIRNAIPDGRLRGVTGRRRMSRPVTRAHRAAAHQSFKRVHGPRN